MSAGLHLKYPPFSYLNEERFSKNTQISNFTKILSLGAELFHANGKTDLKKLGVAYSSFANAPKNGSLSLCRHKTGGRTQCG
jgi:hypothetical protein